MIPPPPRKLSLKARWFALTSRPRTLVFGTFLVGMAMILLLGFVYFLFVIRPPVDHEKMLREGRATSAEVVRIDVVKSTTVNDVNPWRVHFLYRDSGQLFEGQMETMSFEKLADWNPGRKITIKYLDEQTTIPELTPVEVGLGWSTLFYPVPSLLIGLALLTWSLPGAERIKQLLKNGVVQKARVRSNTSGAVLPVPLFRPVAKIQYAWSDDSGTERAGSSHTDADFAAKLVTGDEVEILVSPKNSAHTQIVDERVRECLSGKSAS